MSGPPKKEEPIQQPPGRGDEDRLPASVIADYTEGARVYDSAGWEGGSLVPVVDPFEGVAAEMDGLSVEPLPAVNSGERERLRKIFALIAVAADGRGEPNPFQLAMTCAALVLVCGDDRFSGLPTLNRWALRLGTSVELLSRRVERVSALLGIPNPFECSPAHRRSLSEARRRVLARKSKGEKAA